MKSTLACLRNPHSHIAAANSSDSGGSKFLLKALALAITNLQYYTPKETFRACDLRYTERYTEVTPISIFPIQIPEMKKC